jgi:hypothetical protein
VNINAALNLVVPLYKGDDSPSPYAYVHSRPISVAAFEANFRLLIRTFQTMMGEGPSAFRSANLFLREAAVSLAGKDETPDVLCAPLLNEIKRMSVVIAATPSGWDTVPLQQAIDHGLLDADDAREAVNSVVFFTAVWHVSPKRIRADLLENGTQLWGAQTSSLPPTEWIASLQTLTETANSGAAVPPGEVQITAPNGQTSMSSLPV